MEALARAMIVSSRERMRAPLKDGFEDFDAPDSPSSPDGSSRESAGPRGPTNELFQHARLGQTGIAAINATPTQTGISALWVHGANSVLEQRGRDSSATQVARRPACHVLVASHPSTASLLT